MLPFSPAEALNRNQCAIWRWESGDEAPRKHKWICCLVSEAEMEEEAAENRPKRLMFFGVFFAVQPKNWFISGNFCGIFKSMKPSCSFTGGNNSNAQKVKTQHVPMLNVRCQQFYWDDSIKVIQFLISDYSFKNLSCNFYWLFYKVYIINY